MKTLLAIISLLVLVPVSSRAQDLSGLFPFAHYTLINTPNDALGLQNPMLLMNTVYEGDDGIYFNGKHPVVDQGGSWARTHYMSALTMQNLLSRSSLKLKTWMDSFDV
jgi:hypothetical protein